MPVDVLERHIEDLLTRPRGRPSYAPLVRYRSFEYQAASREVGFIVATLTGANRAGVRFYNQRGTAEQWSKEGKAATHWARLSCDRFRANEVRLNLGCHRRQRQQSAASALVLPVAIPSWSVTSLQQRVFKTGGHLIRHAR